MNTLGNQAEKVALSYLEQQGLTLIKKEFSNEIG
jgi:Holliday junction resolvase-like predicted endonuclease